MRLLRFSRGLFAAAVAGLAVLSLAFGKFAPDWAAMPAWLAYGLGLLLLLASAGLCVARALLPSAVMIATYLATWAVTATPTIASKPLSVGSWYGLCEALAALMGIWILYFMLRALGTNKIPCELRERVPRVVFGLACIEFGLGHFAYPEYTASMVPIWLPGGSAIAHFTGFCHVAAGIALVTGIGPRLAINLEALMMSLFGLLVWVPSLFARPPPVWATPPRNQWSEIEVNLLLAAAAWIVAASMRDCSWGFRFPRRA
jgi:uncharacterized membrane protein YphA (DoxX/SURF4 family)